MEIFRIAVLLLLLPRRVRPKRGYPSSLNDLSPCPFSSTVSAQGRLAAGQPHSLLTLRLTGEFAPLGLHGHSVRICGFGFTAICFEPNVVPPIIVNCLSWIKSLLHCLTVERFSTSEARHCPITPLILVNYGDNLGTSYYWLSYWSAFTLSHLLIFFAL